MLEPLTTAPTYELMLYDVQGATVQEGIECLIVKKDTINIQKYIYKMHIQKYVYKNVYV
jgi:hypothetical protein